MLVVHICLLSMVGFSGQVGAYDEKDVEKLKATGNCQKCDLSEANLEGANLEGADLGGANLTGAKLEGANLEGAKLCRTTMPDGTMVNSGC